MTDFVVTHSPLTTANRACLVPYGLKFAEGRKAGHTSYYPARDGGGYSQAPVEVAEHVCVKYHTTVTWWKP